MKYWENELIKYFDIKNPFEYKAINCPYHDDNTASAGISIKKGHFNCFVCGGKTIKELHQDLFHQESIMKDEFQLKIDFDKILEKAPKPTLSYEEKLRRLKELITEKGLSWDVLKKINAEPIFDESNNLFGYLGIPLSSNKFTARKFIWEVQGPKWYNSNGEKILYILNSDSPDIILVEGIWDLTSLLELGYENVACNLGTEFNQKRAFILKGKVVYILFDNDYAGFVGAEKAYDALRKVKAYPILLDIPQEFGKDVNEAYVKCKDKFSSWLQKQLTQIETSDESFLTRNEIDTLVYPSTITELDGFLQGGFRPGIHVIAGEPGAGKTAFALWLSLQWLLKNSNIKLLYNTYEISKRQCWARITSQFELTENISYPRNWVEIEDGKEPNEISKGKSIQIAKRLKIIAGSDISEIIRASRFYDIIVIDYIQAMPGDTDSKKFDISKNIRILGDLARDKEKIILVISSIPRSQYGKDEIGLFKESGDIEYAMQSGMKIKDTNHDGEHRLLSLTIIKNTRGNLYKTVWLEGNMVFNTFRGISPTGV